MQNLLCESEFYLHENKNHFHIDGFAISLALKQSLGRLENCLLRWRGTWEGVSKGIVLGVGREGGHNHPRSPPPLTDYCLMSHANITTIKDILWDTFIMKRSKDYITLHLYYTHSWHGVSIHKINILLHYMWEYQCQNSILGINRTPDPL